MIKNAATLTKVSILSCSVLGYIMRHVVGSLYPYILCVLHFQKVVIKN